MGRPFNGTLPDTSQPSCNKKEHQRELPTATRVFGEQMMTQRVEHPVAMDTTISLAKAAQVIL